jgi:hypothetical protein
MSEHALLVSLINEMITLREMRVKGLYKLLKNKYENIPTYVFNEFYKGTGVEALTQSRTLLTFKKLNERKWTLEKLKLKPSDFNKRTLKSFNDRQFGKINAWNTPRDAERMEIQKTKVFGDGNNEPVILFRNSNGYELSEGWHRTMNLLLLGKNGEDVSEWNPVLIKAWVGT